MADENKKSTKVEVLSEDEIDQLLAAINTGEANEGDDSNGKRPRWGGRRFYPYDFRRPEIFTRDDVKKISLPMEDFAYRTYARLSPKIGQDFHIHVSSVDTLSLEEIMRFVPEQTDALVFKMEFGETLGRALFEVDSKISNALIERMGNNISAQKMMEEMLCDIEPSFKKYGIDVCVKHGEAYDKMLQAVNMFDKVEQGILVTMFMRIGAESEQIEGEANIFFPAFTIKKTLKGSAKKSSERIGGVEKMGNVLNGSGGKKGIDEISVRISAVLGEAERTLGQLKEWDEGTIIELDRLLGEPIDIIANGSLIAKAEVIVADQNFAVKITEVNK